MTYNEEKHSLQVFFNAKNVKELPQIL